MQNNNTQIVSKHGFVWSMADYGTGPLTPQAIAAALDSYGIFDFDYSHAMTFGVETAMRYVRGRDIKAFNLICCAHGLSLDSYNDYVKVPKVQESLPASNASDAASDAAMPQSKETKNHTQSFATAVSLKQPMMVIQAKNILTGEIKTAPSTRAMADAIGGVQSCVARCLGGKRDQHKGFTFQLIQAPI